jgi:hypothetical protein
LILLSLNCPAKTRHYRSFKQLRLYNILTLSLIIFIKCMQPLSLSRSPYWKKASVKRKATYFIAYSNVFNSSSLKALYISCPRFNITAIRLIARRAIVLSLKRRYYKQATISFFLLWTRIGSSFKKTFTYTSLLVLKRFLSSIKRRAKHKMRLSNSITYSSTY